jgi:bacterioferritin
MPKSNFEAEAVALLDTILENELAGVVRYMHYSFMIYGHNRIPIQKWFREQADESLKHAEVAGELITSLGSHPSLKIGKLIETHKHSIEAILSESLEHEAVSLEAYEKLLEISDTKNVVLAEYARQMIQQEQLHVWEVQKMMRKPGV